MAIFCVVACESLDGVRGTVWHSSMSRTPRLEGESSHPLCARQMYETTIFSLVSCGSLDGVRGTLWRTRMSKKPRLEGEGGHQLCARQAYEMTILAW